jgi:hypothetical protein
LDRLAGAAEARSTADPAAGAAATGAALNAASVRPAAAQNTDINQRRDGAGIGELPFTARSRPGSKGIVRLPGTARNAPH